MLTPPYVDSTSQKLVVTFAEPIQKAGQVSAVIGADVSLEQVVRVVSAIQPTPHSYAFLVGSKGTILAHPEPALRLKPLDALDPALTMPALVALIDYAEATHPLQTLLIASAVAALVAIALAALVLATSITGALNGWSMCATQ